MERRHLIMTVDELARYLRVHTMTVYRLIQRGSLPAIRVGHSWRFRKDHVDGWLAERQVNSNHGRPRAQRSTKKRRDGRGR